MLFLWGKELNGVDLWNGCVKIYFKKNTLCPLVLVPLPPLVILFYCILCIYIFVLWTYCKKNPKIYIGSDTKHFKNTLISYVISFLFVGQKQTTFTTSPFPIFHICKAISRAGSNPLAGHFCPTLHLFDSRALNDSCINNEK